ncbi:hypothetical protein EON65_43310 [archaeon]|nr:MAG: hypothetical protein EON65_43310 [archaeon]
MFMDINIDALTLTLTHAYIHIHIHKHIHVNTTINYNSCTLCIHPSITANIGIEVLTLTCRNVEEPTKKVPRTMVLTMAAMYISALCVVLTAGSVYPGPLALAKSDRTFDPLLVHVLHASHHFCALFMLPGAVGSAFGFMYAFGQQLHSMANSGLLCGILRMVYGPYGTPYLALITGSAIGYVFIMALHLAVHDLEEVVHDLFDICLLGSCSVDITLLCAYHVYKSRYSNLGRTFTNPLGYVGVGYGLVVFAFLAVSIAFFSEDHYAALLAFGVLLLAGFTWYKFVAQRTEFFSKEEQEQFMKAYVLNANVMKKRKTKKSKSGSKRNDYLSWLRSSVNPGVAANMVSMSHNTKNYNDRKSQRREQELSGVVPK